MFENESNESENESSWLLSTSDSATPGCSHSSLIKSAPFSATITTGAWMLPDGIVGTGIEKENV